MATQPGARKGPADRTPLTGRLTVTDRTTRENVAERWRSLASTPHNPTRLGQKSFDSPVDVELDPLDTRVMRSPHPHGVPAIPSARHAHASRERSALGAVLTQFEHAEDLVNRV
jgi:hypothetical protein